MYQECADNEVIERSKEEYIMELVDTPIAEPAWQSLMKCKIIQVKKLRTYFLQSMLVILSTYIKSFANKSIMIYRNVLLLPNVIIKPF